MNLVAASVLTRSENLVRMCEQVAENVGDRWQQWYLTEHPELESLPSDSAVDSSAGSMCLSILFTIAYFYILFLLSLFALCDKCILALKLKADLTIADLTRQVMPCEALLADCTPFTYLFIPILQIV